MATRILARFDAFDRAITRWMAKVGVPALRVSLGVIFLWFGFLKFFPAMSPAEALASDTIAVLTFGWIEPRVALFVLAAWECAIGVGLITGRALRATLLLLFLQMPGTIAPMLVFPEVTFTSAAFALTLEGQYIVKNLVLVSAGLVIGATVRGGRLVPGAQLPAGA